MLRRRIAKHHPRNLFILTLACFCGSIILIGGATSTRVAAKRPSMKSQEGAQKLSPENLSTTMYGGNGGHSNSDSINDGSLVIIDQSTAAITLVGHPNGIARLTGLTFDSTGKLFASTLPAGGFPPPPPPMTSTLVTINAANGSLVSTIGTISDGAPISIADLAVQPGTDLLFGVRGPNDGNGGQGNLYTIDKSTGVATLVGNTSAFFASIAFAPDGTLFEAAADLGMMGNAVNFRIMKVNPSNGAIISSVPTSQLFGALGVRPTDGVIFGGTGDSHQIFTINATTGTATLIGDTGQNFVGDLAFSPVSNAGINAYRQTNLVSDIPGAAQILDPNLVNPWGVSFSATSPFWISNNGSGTATLYAGDTGTPLTKNPLTVTIPGGGNTGIVFNGSSDFVITDGTGTGAARFIFATEAGTIAAWRAGTVAVTKVTTPNAVYKGLAIGNNGTANFLYAANFSFGKIDVFDKNFAAATLAGNFTDPALPAGYAPFNIQNLGGKLYVMYALQDADKKDDVPGAGHGFVDTFDLNGNLLGRLISAGALNSPWGIALSPANFGQFGGNELLIGNFGDGRINAYNQTTGASLGTLDDQSGNPLVIDGLWALTFGNGVNGGDPNTLYFSAGLGDESHGLFGKLNAASPAFVFVEFSSLTYSVSEGAGFIDISVTRSGVTSTALTVNFATYEEPGAGNASPTSDFIPTLGTLSFASGEITKTFSVLLVDDGYVEGDETFKVILSNPTGAALKPTTIAEVTITDNDTASTTIPTPLTFVASLNGAQEVPPKVTNGKGTGVVIITDEASGAAKVSIAFSGLTSNENAAHIHGPGAPGVNAPILFPLPNAPATSGSVNDFSFTMTPAQIQQLRDGLFYINVHTDNNPGGEIRGQLLSNPIDETGVFVRQQYLDFLNREPDPGGLSFWTNQITGCGVNTTCVSNKRIDVSREFFLSQEFQVTDFFVYSVRKASFGALPTFSQFTLDRSQIGPGSPADKKTFTEAFVQNGEFLGVYPTTQTGSDFIDKLIATILQGSGVDLSSKKPELENEYLMESTQAASRARVLRKVVSYPEFINAEFNKGFVAAEYYGYLRRTPDVGGFNFWLNVLDNGVPGNSRSMVCAFITSAEYYARFGPNATRNNDECAGAAP